MADFDIKDIAALKVKLQIIEKLVLADWILLILSMYYDWGGWIASLIGLHAESMSPMVFDGQVIMMPYDFVIL